MATIVVTTEVDFAGTGTWIDISQYVTRVGISYGRKRILTDASAGSCNITVENRTNWLTPGHSDSTYGNTQLLNRSVRVSAATTGGSDSYSTYLFRGTITDLDMVAGHDTSTVTIKVVDGFSKLATASIFNQTFTLGYTGVRVAEVLDLATVDYPDSTNPLDRNIDLGLIEAQAQSGVTAGALDYLQQLARTEGGKLLVNHAGTPSATNFGGVLTFLSANASTFDPGVTVSDAATLPTGGVEAVNLAFQYGSEQLFNSAEITSSTDAVQQASDTTSITKYGERVTKRTVLSDNTDAAELASYLVHILKETDLRVAAVTVDIDSQSIASAEKLLHVNVHSALGLRYMPPGSSTAIEDNLVVEGVKLDIRPRDMVTNAARIRGTYSTSSADAGYFTLDDPALGSFPVVLAPSWVVTHGFRLDDPDLGTLPVGL